MSREPINSWIENAKQADGSAPAAPGVQVIKRAQGKSRGQLIMEIAEKVRPHLMKFFEGVRDENEMLVQPARVRAVALNLAQRIVTEEEKKSA